jgi:hypothetical protein
MPRSTSLCLFPGDEEAPYVQVGEGVLSLVTMPQCLRQLAPLFKKLDERAIGEEYARLAE